MKPCEDVMRVWMGGSEDVERDPTSTRSIKNG